MAMEKDCDIVSTLKGTEFIRALTEGGVTVQIPVSELGKVMGKVIPPVDKTVSGLYSSLMLAQTLKYKGSIMYNDKNAVDSANETGIYRHDDSVYGTTSGHGILIVLNVGTYIAQIDISNKGILFFRFYHGFGDWSAWKSVYFT